jgi:small neutral amino acid transporter SnatA (MarC family)
MEKLSKYKNQIFAFITIWLLLEFGVYPCLTMANTFANIIGALGLLGILLWVGVQLMEAIKEPSHIETAINEDLKTIKKPKRKTTKTK